MNGSRAQLAALTGAGAALALACIAGTPGTAAGDGRSAGPTSGPAADLKEQRALESGCGDWRTGRESDPDSSGFDALHVELTVEFLIAQQAINGQARWTLRIRPPAPTGITFDLNDSLEVTSAAIGGTRVPFTHAADRLTLYPPDPYAPGDTLTARVTYHGRPSHGFMLGLGFSDHEGIPVIYSNCEPVAAHTWWPCKDRPDDKFTADLRYIVPDSLIAAANGVLAETIEEPDGRRLYHWVERYPITTYLVSIVATNFVEFADTYTGLDGTRMPLTYYAFPEDIVRAQQDWAFTPTALRFFAETFGEYPFLAEKYGMAQFPWSGAMEHQTLTSMGTYFLRLPRPADWVVVHELAHQWWGDWVTCATWRDIWLNEGFATYCEALWAEHLGGPDSLRAVMERKRSDEFRGACYDPIFLFNSTVYRKGAWALHMLRHVIGDSTFFASLRAYGEDHAYGGVMTSDLQKACEREWDGELSWFFNEWVYGKGQPRYRVFWDPLGTEVTGTTAVRVQISQETTGPEYFKMPLDACFWLGDGSEFWTVLWDSLPEQSFLVETPARPESLAIDPDGWVLGRVVCVVEPSTIASDSEPGTGVGTIDALVLGEPTPSPAGSGAGVVLPIQRAADGYSAAARSAPVLQIYDVSGRLVRSLSATWTTPAAGRFTWDGNDELGRTVPAGIYLGMLGRGTNGQRGEAKRILIVR